MANVRAVELWDDFSDLIKSFITRHGITRAEYAAIMDYVISVGKSDEWPLWLDAFFESVMVNADDPALRANRLGLLAQLHAAMNRVADLSKLAS